MSRLLNTVKPLVPVRDYSEALGALRSRNLSLEDLEQELERCKVEYNEAREQRRAVKREMSEDEVLLILGRLPSDEVRGGIAQMKEELKSRCTAAWMAIWAALRLIEELQKQQG